MYQAIQVSSRLLYCLSHLIITVQIEYIRDEVQGILIVLNFGIQASKIESISQVVFVDFAKVLVTSRRNEL